MDQEYWVLMSKYLSNEISLEETDKLLKWIDEDPERVELLLQLQTSLDKTAIYDDANCDFDSQVAWKKVLARTNNSLQTKQANVRSLNWMKYAAAFILFLNLGWMGWYFYSIYKPIVYVNREIVAKEILLPDGSKVWLNQGSQLSYRNGFDTFNERRVSLTGEAFFDVVPNQEKPFFIENLNTITKVLGTSFNVKSFKEQVSVTVFTGKVSFKEINNSLELKLLPGEKGVFEKSKGLIKSKYENKNFMFWKDQKLDFDNLNLVQVLPVIASVYGVKFVVLNEELKQKRITTSFHKQSLVEVIEGLEFLLDTKIEQAENVYVVK